MDLSSIDQMKILHSPFDIDLHKKVFTNYLEVVILPDGTIEYAVPSHSEKIYQLYQEKYNLDRDQLYSKLIGCRLCVSDLAEELEVVMVWSDHILCNFNMTPAQKKSVDSLIRYNLLSLEEKKW